MRFHPVAEPRGPVLVEPEVHRDARGAFREGYHEERYRRAGIVERFVQVNCSRSVRGVLRGLHFQNPSGQAKLVWVSRGEVFDVTVDVRAGSPTFGKWFGVRLSDVNGRQLFIPRNFAHGFVALSEEADLIYLCSDFYRPEHEHVLRWDDPVLGIDWPATERGPIVSERDSEGWRLAQLEGLGVLPRYLG